MTSFFYRLEKNVMVDVYLLCYSLLKLVRLNRDCNELFLTIRVTITGITAAATSASAALSCICRFQRPVFIF